MVDRIPIDRNVLIYNILDRLDVPDLIKFLTTNSKSKELLSTLFADNIKDYYEELQYSRDQARQKTHERLQVMSSYCPNITRQIILLSPQLSRFMGVNYMPKNNGQVLYTIELLEIWWLVYLSKISGINVGLNENSVPVTVEFSSLINVAVGSLVTVENTVHHLRQLYTFINVPNLSVETIQYFIEEYHDLHNNLKLFLNQELKNRNYPLKYIVSQYNKII